MQAPLMSFSAADVPQQRSYSWAPPSATASTPPSLTPACIPSTRCHAIRN
jgi:hypothetical protein